jgi:ABC-2 type transport system ATP-binding protein
MIEINNISKSFKQSKGNKKKMVIDKITISIEDGKIIGLLGPNGAGKTTLIKMICNLITPDDGDIKIDGESIYKNIEIVHKKVGVVLEGARNLYNFLTVNENLNYFSYLNEMEVEKFEETKLKFLKLFDLEDKINVTVNTLSRGMQQKVAILIAILKDPQILILDEPTLGLDIISQIKMKKVLRDLAIETNKTLIISSHDMSLIKDICEKVCILNKGKLVEYGDIHNIENNGSVERYKLILKNKEYLINTIKENNYEFRIINEFTIECISRNADKILSIVKSTDIYSIERMNNGLEELLKGLGDSSENNIFS